MYMYIYQMVTENLLNMQSIRIRLRGMHPTIWTVDFLPGVHCVAKQRLDLAVLGAWTRRTSLPWSSSEGGSINGGTPSYHPF